VNGKQGDHPVADVVEYGLAVFTPEIDQLIVEINELGGWESVLANAHMLSTLARWRELQDRDPATAEVLIHNLGFLLREELERLRA
jgi:hypothetical protein